MREVTATQVADLLDAAVREKGEDFIYKPIPLTNDAICRYLHGTQPGCLIGHVLLRLGAIPTELDLQEGQPANLLDYARLGLSIGANAIEALQAAQEAQDNGETWGTARKAFHGVLGRFNAPSNA